MAVLDEWQAADGTIISLDGTEGIKVLRGVAGLDSPPVRNTLEPRVNADGATHVNSRRPERPMTLPLHINVDEITPGEVTRLFQGPGVLRSTSGRELREVIYDGGLEGLWNAERGGVEGLDFRQVPISLLALDPWWYGPVQSVSGSFGSPTPWDAAIPWDSNIPWNGGASESVTVLGDAPAKPTIVITGAAITVSMSVGGVGGWETAAPVLSADYLSVSGDPGRRGPHRGPHGLFAGADGPIDWGLLTEGSQLFDMPPGVQSLVFGASGTDGSTSWTMAWSPRFLTP